MNGYCTYTVEVRDDDDVARDVPCGKARTGEVVGVVNVVLCKRHFETVSRNMSRLGTSGMRLLLDAPPPIDD